MISIFTSYFAPKIVTQTKFIKFPMRRRPSPQFSAGNIHLGGKLYEAENKPTLSEILWQ